MDDDGVCFGTRFLFGFALNTMKSDEKKLLFLSKANRISVGGVPDFRASMCKRGASENGPSGSELA